MTQDSVGPALSCPSMDNLCHSLVGVALGHAGLNKKTALATATLVIGANLPDVDVFAYVWGSETALGFRRGWTHGILALGLWPFILTGIILAWDRFVRRRRRPDAEPADPRALFLLSTVSILSHPFLDWMNTYGLRWLMPFRDVWYYGDVLFIIDPWIWLALGAGWLGSRLLAHRGSPRAVRPARAALALVSVYILILWGTKLAAADAARGALERQGLAVGRLMAGPVLRDPFRRQIVAESGDRYVLGSVDWRRHPVFTPGDPPLLVRNRTPWIEGLVQDTPGGTHFLHWARFPFFRVEEDAVRGRTKIMAMDARYTLTPNGFGSFTLSTATAPPPRPPR